MCNCYCRKCGQPILMDSIHKDKFRFFRFHHICMLTPLLAHQHLRTDHRTMGPIDGLEKNDSSCSNMFFLCHHYYSLQRYLKLFLEAYKVQVRTCSHLNSNIEYQLEVMDTYKCDAILRNDKDLSGITTRYLALVLFYKGSPSHDITNLDSNRKYAHNHANYRRNEMNYLNSYFDFTDVSKFNTNMREVFFSQFRKCIWKSASRFKEISDILIPWNDALKDFWSVFDGSDFVVSDIQRKLQMD